MLHVFFGPESFSRREAVDQLKAKLDTDGSLQTNTVLLDARRASPQEVMAACDTVPFLGPCRLVIVEGVLERAAAGGRGKRGTDDEAGGAWQALVDYVDRMPPTSTLVLVDGDVRAEGSIVKALREKGEVRQFRPPNPRSLPGWIQNRARGMDLRLDAAAAKMLADLVGDKLWTLANELDKLAAYASGQAIGEKEVEALVSEVRDLKVWALTDAVVDGKPAVALRLLRRMLAQEMNPSYILATVQGQYRRLAVAREMLDGGASERAVGERLKARGFGLEKLLERALRYPLERAPGDFRRILEADAATKRGIYDDELALELLVYDLATARRRAA
jgi:DNA polymerase-3 subunit delta